MRIRTLMACLSLLTLAACGGGNEPAPINLQGLWYQIDPRDLGSFTTPYVFAQNGRDITITNCARSTSVQTLVGEVLTNPDGMRASWQPAGDNTLTGRFGASAGAEWRRFSTTPVFDSGRVSLQGQSLTALQATQDVCAIQSSAGFTTANGSEVRVPAVMITAPYRGSHVEITISLQDLRAGEFVVGDSNFFLQNLASASHVQVRSSAFRATLGRDTLAITGGTLRVAVLPSGAYSFDATLNLDTGSLLAVSAEVALRRRP